MKINLAHLWHSARGFLVASYRKRGGVWGATEGSFYGVLSGDSLEGLVIGSMVGSGLGLAVGVKDAYDGFQSDTSACSSS